jgi:hypothetical protein
VPLFANSSKSGKSKYVTDNGAYRDSRACDSVYNEEDASRVLCATRVDVPVTVENNLILKNASFRLVLWPFVFCLVFEVWALTTCEGVLHWFLLPLTSCGVLIGIEAMKWITGEYSLLDPAGIVGAVGIHFFFCAPILQVVLGYTPAYVIDEPSDYRPWLGFVAVLNFFGLLLYRAALKRFCRKQTRPKKVWLILRQRFLLALVACCAVSLVAEFWVLSKFGGLSGYIEAFEQGKEAFTNMGWAFMISEAFPILLMFVVAAASWRKRISFWLLLGIFAAFLLLEFVFGGLRGSRHNVLLAAVWAAGIIHLTIRPISRRTVVIGCLLAIVFMYFYAFYKSVGMGATRAVIDRSSREQIVAETNRSFAALVIGDLSRSDVHSLLVYRLVQLGGTFDYAWGRTYLGALNLVVPRFVYPDRLPTKVKWATDMEYGVGQYDAAHYPTSRVYGIAGEAAMNFSIFAIPFSYFVFGLIVNKLRTFSSGMNPQDVRLLLVPFLAYWAVVVLAHESEISLFLFAKNCSLPLLAMWLGSSSKRVVGLDTACTFHR